MSNRSIAAAWLRATTAGWVLGFVLAVALIILTDSLGPHLKFPLGLGMGLGLGFLQQRVIRPHVVSRNGWLYATAFGLTAPFLVFDVISFIRPDMELSIPLLVAAGGVLIAILQQRVLASTFSDSRAWLLSEPIAWIVAGSSIMVSESLPKGSGPSGAAIYIGVIFLGGIILGIIEGQMLQRIVGRHAAAT